MRSPRRANRDFSSETNSKPLAPRAEFRPHNGAVALFLDNRPQVPLVVDVAAETSSSQLAESVQGGARLFRLRHIGLGWNSPNRSEFDKLETRVQAGLQAAPTANFLLEVDVEAPEWWRRASKAECAVYCLGRALPDETGNEEGRPREKSAGSGAEAAPECVSRASRRWLLEAGDALARLVQHVTQSAWSERCIGFQIAGGENGSWRHPEWTRLPDVGPRMTERFRAFCVDKYRRNGGLLKQSWDDPRADFDRIKCPDAHERRYADVGCLRDPLRSRRMLDYYECFYTVQNEAALHFCQIAKRAGGGRPVGLSYASTMGTLSNAEGCWGLPESVFDSENVDYLVADAQPPEVFAPTAFTGSLKLRGKFLFVTARSAVSATADAGMALTIAAGALLPAAAERKQMETLMKAGERSLSANVGSSKHAAQVALIVDAFGLTYLAGKDEIRAEWQRALFVEQFQELCQTGAQMETYLQSDLFHPKFPDHKVTVFLNPLYLSEAERRKIDARVKRGQQTAVWFWGAGLLSEKGVEETAAGKLVGMKVRMEKNATSLRARIVEGNDALTWGLHVGTNIGSERAVLPTVTIGDKTVTRLGANSANKTTFAARRNETWTSVCYGTLPVPVAPLRNLMGTAGVHLYTATTNGKATVYANARLVVVSSQPGGSVKVSLPGAHEVVDTQDGKRIATGSDVELKLAPGETRLLELKPQFVAKG